MDRKDFLGKSLKGAVAFTLLSAIPFKMFAKGNKKNKKVNVVINKNAVKRK